MKKTLRWLLLPIAALGGQLTLAQPIENAQQAIATARRYATELGVDVTFDNADVKTPQGQRSSAPQHWVVWCDRGERVFGLSGVTGHLTGFGDGAADQRRHDRKPGTVERIVTTEEQAWEMAEQFLQIAGLGSSSFARAAVVKSADKPGADLDRNNRADVYICNFVQRPNGFEHVMGAVNSAAITIDLCEGRVLTATASEEWDFSPPKSLMGRMEAMEAFRKHFAAEGTAINLRAGYDLHWYDWPGDGQVMSDLYLFIQAGGKPTLTSAYGESLTNENIARVCWSLTTKHGVFLIDAENGNPVMFGVEGGATSTMALKLGADENSIGRTNAPPRSNARAEAIPNAPVNASNTDGCTTTWAALGSVAAVGFGLILWRFFFHR